MMYLWQVIPALLVVISCLIWAIDEIQIEIALSKSGVNAEAKITKLENTSSGRLLYSRVEFQYYVDEPGLKGGQYTKGQIIGPSNFQRLAEGSQVTVRYLPLKPFVAQLTGEDVDHESRNIALLAVGLAFVIWIVSVIQIVLTSEKFLY